MNFFQLLWTFAEPIFNCFSKLFSRGAIVTPFSRLAGYIEHPPTPALGVSEWPKFNSEWKRLKWNTVMKYYLLHCKQWNSTCTEAYLHLFLIVIIVRKDWLIHLLEGGSFYESNFCGGNIYNNPADEFIIILIGYLEVMCQSNGISISYHLRCEGTSTIASPIFANWPAKF